MTVIWDTDKIQDILPQRPPFLFIDRVIEVNEKERKAVCLKNLTINDYFFKGHFPGNPVMPGVLIIETAAQAGIILFAALKPEIAAGHPDYYLGRVEAKFLKSVSPGCRLILKVTADKITNSAGIVEAVALVDGGPVARARLSFGVKLKR